MTPTADEPLFVVTLRPLKDPLYPHRPREATLRLRSALKHLLRCQGLRAVAIEEVRPGRPAPAVQSER